MDELQTSEVDHGITLDSAEGNEVEQQPLETAESGAELATAAEEKQDKNEDGAQKAINKQHAKYREEERKRIAAEDKARELEDRLSKIEADKGEVVVPPPPDPYSENYEDEVRLRDEAIMRKAAQDAEKAGVTARIKEQEADSAKAEQERINGLVTDYDKQTVKLGLDPEEVKKAGETIVGYGISGDLAEYILGDVDGPLIAKYLADNPVELDDLRGMTPINAAMKINTGIRAAASANKPQTSAAPDPAEVLSGNGAPEKVSPVIAGAKFD